MDSRLRSGRAQEKSEKMNEQANLPSPRFVALDGWRGICACLVALFHFKTNSHIYDLPFFRDAYLFVDFFFVLSGFVIFANYADRLREGFGVRKFLWLRFGRLYPLHLATFLAFVGFDMLQIVFPILGVGAHYKPFSAPGETPGFMLSNLLLTQALGFHERLTFNGPSWSISAEFYTYVLFSLALITLRKNIVWLVAFLLLAAPVFLAVFSSSYMDTTLRFGFIRCLFGFSAGAATWMIYKRYGQKIIDSMNIPFVWNAIEGALVLSVVIFVTLAGTGATTLFAPLLFGATVWGFSFERGAISRLLRSPFFIFLGLLSYSIYMNHMFISGKVFFGVIGIIEKFSSIELTSQVGGQNRIGTTIWQGDMFCLVYLCVLIMVSYLTYKIIEEPGRLWFRKAAR